MKLLSCATTIILLLMEMFILLECCRIRYFVTIISNRCIDSSIDRSFLPMDLIDRIQ